MIHRTILEWQRLAYGSGTDQIPEGVASGLAAAAAGSNFSGRQGDGVLNHGRKALQARGIVGVLASEAAQLEILPKIVSPGELDAADNATLRHRLVQMLGVALNLKIDNVGMARLGLQRDTLLEVLIRLYCHRLTEAVRKGIPRRYLNQTDDLPALRGRLNATRQFSVMAASPDRLACEFDELSVDIPMNQVMKATVLHLSRLARAGDNQKSLRELAFAYADVSDVPLAGLLWDDIPIDRTNQRWADLLTLARLLLGEKYQKTSGGKTEGHALLFKMHVLFEDYVARLLKKALAGTGFQVSSQGGHRSCLYDGDVGRFRTKPDLIIRRGNTIVMIIDTKWKQMAPQIDDPKQGVSQGDVYQLMAYSQLYDCPQTMLLYPYHFGLGGEATKRLYSIAAQGSPNSLTMATIDVTTTAQQCAANLGRLVLSSFPDASPS